MSKNIYYKIKVQNYSDLDNLSFANQTEVCNFIRNNHLSTFNVYKVTLYLPEQDGSAVIMPPSPEKIDVTDEIKTLLSNSNSSMENSEQADKPSMGLNILSIILPIVGIILYFCYKDRFPQKAKQCLVYAACGFALGVIIMLL